MSRFELAAAVAQKRPFSEKANVQVVNLRDALTNARKGIFNVRAKVQSFGFKTYKSCVLSTNGRICNRKLDGEDKCVSCQTVILNPKISMFIKLQLADVEESEQQQNVMLFNDAAERFFGLKADELREMAATEIDQKLEHLIGIQMVFKVNIKDHKGENFEGLDWIVNDFERSEEEKEVTLVAEHQPKVKKTKKN